jgi:hypothetical protein
MTSEQIPPESLRLEEYLKTAGELAEAQIASLKAVQTALEATAKPLDRPDDPKVAAANEEYERVRRALGDAIWDRQSIVKAAEAATSSAT